MNNFEEAILPYVEKKVDKDNPNIVTYNFKKIRRTYTYNVQNVSDNIRNGTLVGKRHLSMHTPLGYFATVAEAAKAHNVTVPTVMKYTKTKPLEFWYHA